MQNREFIRHEPEKRPNCPRCGSKEVRFINPQEAPPKVVYWRVKHILKRHRCECDRCGYQFTPEEKCIKKYSLAKSVYVIIIITLVIGLILSFIGVEPLATYKDKAVQCITNWWDSTNELKSSNTTVLDKNEPVVAEANLFDTDIKNYITVFNQYRKEYGCGDLEFTDDLNEIASLRLAEIKVNFSHYSVGKYNRYLGENIVRGVFDNDTAFYSWQVSTEHNANMLDEDYKYSGYAIGGGYAVQVFSRWDTINGEPQLPDYWYFTD